MNTDTVWQVITGAIILAIIVLLVKPNSPGPDAVKAISESLANLVKSATGYTSNT